MKGLVEKVTKKKSQTGKTYYELIIDGEKYSTWEKVTDVGLGDYVEFDMQQKGIYKNAKNIRLTKKEEAKGDTRNQDIMKMAIIKDAVEMVSMIIANKEKLEEVKMNSISEVVECFQYIADSMWIWQEEKGKEQVDEPDIIPDED